MTVGATTVDDHLWASSNRGTCVDVLAPGDNIRSAAPGGGSRTASGTAMAAAHAAGVAVTFLSAQPLTSAQVTAKIKETATKNAVSLLLPLTPNLLLFNGYTA